MKNDLFVVAIKDGKYISVDEFKSGVGQKCGCSCPLCGEAVQSNVSSRTDLSRKYTNHFSHINDFTNCSGGYKETELHLLAKNIIESSFSIVVPSQKYHYPDTIFYNKVYLEPAFPIAEFKQYRPDIIILTKENVKIAIEVVVTSDISNIKIELYEKHQIKCLRIGLYHFWKKDIKHFKTEIEFAILKDSKCKYWVWPKLPYLDEALTGGVPSSESNNSPTSGQGCLLSVISITIVLGSLVSLSLYLSKIIF